MKKTIVFLFLVSSILFINAQTLEWVTSGAGDNVWSRNDIGYSVDSNKDFICITGYVAGHNVRIQDTVILDGQTAFLAKYDKYGELDWVKNNEGTKRPDVTIDGKGDIYLSYTTWDLRGNIIKYDINGNELWNKEIKNIEAITSIHTDKDDKLIVAGNYWEFRDSLVIEDTVIHDFTRDRNNNFVMKYNASGDFEWFSTSKVITKYQGGSIVYFHDLQSDNNGDLYVIGDFILPEENDSIQFGDFIIKPKPKPADFPFYISHYDIVVAKLDSKGQFLWANSYGGFGDDFGNGIDVNDLGEVFIVGNYADSINFNDIKITGCGTDIYLCKLNTTGDIEWANKLGSNSCNHTLEVGRTVSTGENSVYVGGTYPGSYFFFGSTNLEDTIINNGSSTRAAFFTEYSFEGDIIGVNNLIGEEASIENIDVNRNPRLFQ